MPAGGRLHDLEFGDGGLAEALDFAQAASSGGMDRFGERAKGLDQRLGQRLDVAARDGAEQHHFEQFVVAQRVCSRLAKALAQTFAMAVIMRRLLARCLLVNWIAGLVAHRLQCAVAGKFCNREVRREVKCCPRKRDLI